VADTDGAADDQKLAVNAIYRSPDGREYVLVIVESRPWAADVLDELIDRIEVAVIHALDGGLLTDVPEAEGCTIRVHVDYLQPAGAEVEDLFTRAEAALARRGLTFSASLLDDGGA
jgi:hypothetical protein